MSDGLPKLHIFSFPWWANLFSRSDYEIFCGFSPSSFKMNDWTSVLKRSAMELTRPPSPPYCLFWFTADLYCGLLFALGNMAGLGDLVAACLIGIYSSVEFIKLRIFHIRQDKSLLGFLCFTDCRKRRWCRSAMDMVLSYYKWSIPSGHLEEVLSEDW